MASDYFNMQRASINRQTAQNQQDQSDAINRRFTSLGQAGSGAAIAAQIKGRDQVTAQGNQAMNDLGGQQLQSAYQEANLAEGQKNRDFQAQQADLGRTFESGQNQAGREFAAQQNLLGQQFQGTQAGLGRELQSSEFNTDQGNKLKQLDMSQQSLNLESDAQKFNEQMAQFEATRQPPGLLGMGGFLGTGLGSPNGVFNSKQGTSIWNGYTGVATNGVAPAYQAIDSQLSKWGI